MVVARADARDLGRRAEQRPGDLARDHVDLVARGQGDDHVGAVAAGGFEHGGVRGVPGDRPDVEAVLEVRQQGGVGVDHGHVVGLAGEVFGQRGPDLTRSQDDDFHREIAVVATLEGRVAEPAGR